MEHALALVACVLDGDSYAACTRACDGLARLLRQPDGPVRQVLTHQHGLELLRAATTLILVDTFEAGRHY